MLNCGRCKVNIDGDKIVCPLCQGELTGIATQDSYPDLPKPKYGKNFLLRLISFVAVAIIIVSLALNLMVRSDVWWSLFVIGGVASAWITATVGISYRRKLFTKITWQLVIVSVFAVIWDVSTLWRGWSIDYVIPISCLVSMLSMVILSKIMKIPAREYLIYLVLDAVYGVTPIIFYFTGVLGVVYPSLICVTCSLISIFAILFFQGKSIRAEITRRFHL